MAFLAVWFSVLALAAGLVSFFYHNGLLCAGLVCWGGFWVPRHPGGSRKFRVQILGFRVEGSGFRVQGV